MGWFLRLRFLFCELCLANLGDLHQLTLFAFDDLVLYQDVVHRVRRLSTFADPVLGAVSVELHGWWVGECVVRTKDFKSFSPWIASFFTHDKAVRRLLLFSNARQTNGQHVSNKSEE